MRKKIEEGIIKFFDFLKVNFKKSPIKNINEISIFLAGNSAKSKLFNKILSEYLGSDYEYNYEDEHLTYGEDLYKKVEIVTNIKKELGNPDLKFVVYPPLKTQKAKEKLQSMEYDVDLNDPTEPSGKTGVAYGMLVGRVRVDDINTQRGDDVVFPFYVGVEKRHRLVGLVIKNGDGFGVWKKLCPVSSQMTNPYYFYYTKFAEAESGKMPIDRNTPHREIPVTDPKDGTFIFIRALNHNTVQCQIADSEENLQDIEDPSMIFKLD